MDYANFPPPYNREVARRIDQAVEELSPEGLKVLERITVAFATPEPAEPPEALVADMVPLPRADQAVLVGLNRLLAEAFHAAAQENQGHLDLLAQEGRIFGRAAELDPAFAARGGAVTLGEAVAVLRQHGEAPGISEEVLEMIVKVPLRDE